MKEGRIDKNKLLIWTNY